MTRLPNTPYRANPRVVHGTHSIRGVVIHTVEGSAAGAESWFKDPRASGLGAQVIVGLRSVVQIAPLEALVYHAAGANSTTVGFEHEGYASQSKATWIARVFQRKLSANRLAWICYHYGLGAPQRYKNVWGHVDFPQGGHHDPGPNFPWELYLKAANRAYRNLVRSKGKRWTVLPRP